MTEIDYFKKIEDLESERQDALIDAKSDEEFSEIEAKYDALIEQAWKDKDLADDERVEKDILEAEQSDKAILQELDDIEAPEILPETEFPELVDDLGTFDPSINDDVELPQSNTAPTSLDIYKKEVVALISKLTEQYQKADDELKIHVEKKINNVINQIPKVDVDLSGITKVVFSGNLKKDLPFENEAGGQFFQEMKSVDFDHHVLNDGLYKDSVFTAPETAYYGFSFNIEPSYQGNGSVLVLYGIREKKSGKYVARLYDTIGKHDWSGFFDKKGWGDIKYGNPKTPLFSSKLTKNKEYEIVFNVAFTDESNKGDTLYIRAENKGTSGGGKSTFLQITQIIN